MTRGRPPMPIGTWGKINRTEVRPGFWFAETYVRDADGVTRRVRRYSPGGVDRKGAAAERELVAHLAKRDRTPSGGDIAADTTIADLWTAYRAHLTEQGRAPKTFERYDVVAKRITTGLREVRLREASTQRLDRFLRAVEKHSPADAKTARTILTGMFKLAVRYGVLDVNPVRETQAADVTPKRKARAFTATELAQVVKDVSSSTLPCVRLLTAAEKRAKVELDPAGAPTIAEYCAAADLEDPVTMLAATGVRISELLGIRWGDIDFDARTVTVRSKVVRAAGQGLQLVEAEDDVKNRDRILELPAFAVSMLRRRKLAQPPNELGVVFASAAGGLRDPNNTTKQWRRVRRALGIDWVSPHTFRKTVATLIDDAGLSARVAADQLGHARASTTQDWYMARGRVHPEVAAVIESAVISGE